MFTGYIQLQHTPCARPTVYAEFIIYTIYLYVRIVFVYEYNMYYNSIHYMSLYRYYFEKGL